MIGLIAVTLFAVVTDTTLPVYELEEIVVTATRISQPLRDVPIATTVITRKEIERTSAKNVSEVIRGAAGVDIKSYGPEGSVNTVSLRGAASTQVLVLVDGKPVNSISTGSTDLGRFPLRNVQRIEIVRGPTSHLYGANALGGVVNIITRQLPQEMITGAHGSYGAFNTHHLGSEHGGQWKNLRYLATGEIKRSDGFRYNSDHESNDLSAKLSYALNRALSAKASLSYHDDEFGFPGPVPPEGLPAKYGNKEVTSLFDRQKDRNTAGEIRISWDPTQSLALTLGSYRSEDILDYAFRHDDWWNWTSDPIEDNNEYVTQITGGNVQCSFRPGRGTIVGGVDARKIEYYVTQRMVNINTGNDTTNEWSSDDTEHGVWIEGQTRALYPVTITSGVRYDGHTKYGSEVSPNIGAVCHMGGSVVRISYGKAYRAPSFNDLYWPTGGNPDLKPESGWSLETGIGYTVNHTAVVNISLFTRQTESKIAWAPDTGGNWKPQNVNEHTCRGGEIEIRSNLTNRVSVGFTYTYLDPRQTNKETVYSDWMTGETRQEFKTRMAAFTPRDAIGADFAYSPGAKTRFDLRSRFAGHRLNYYPNYDNSPYVTMDTKKLKSCLVMNGRFTYSVMRRLKLSIGVNNILNEEYAEQFGTTLTDRDYPMPARTYTAGVAYDF